MVSRNKGLSREMHWVTQTGNLSLVIDSKPWQSIEDQCRKAKDCETGGVLIGYYSEDTTTAVITEISAPPHDSDRGPTWFHRGVAGLKQLLLRRWKSVKRTYYLGEWHYHPSTLIEPSGDDLDQMLKINCAPNYQCREPIMLIIGQNVTGTRQVRAFVFPRELPYVEYQRISK